jgi:hypothetical protein
MRDSVKAQVVQLAGILAATAIFYLIIVLVAEFDTRFQLVVFKPSPSSQHGEPAISMLGLSLFLALLSVLALAAGRLVWDHEEGRLRRWGALVALGVSVGYVAVVHPYLLAVMLPQRQWIAYVAAVERYVPPLYDIYAGWRFRELLAYVGLLHGILLYVSLRGLKAILVRRAVVPLSSANEPQKP